MTFHTKRLLLAAAAALLVSCHQGASTSQLKAEDDALSNHPFQVYDVPQNPRRAGEIFGLLTPADPTATSKCTRCHQTFRTPDGLQALYQQTYYPYWCFNGNVKDLAQSKLIMSCLASLKSDKILSPNEPGAPTFSDEKIRAGLLDLSAAELGLFSASFGSEAVQTAFKTAGFEDVLTEWKSTLSMPFHAKAMSDADFKVLLTWVMNDFPEKEKMLVHNGPNICEDSSKTFIGSKVRAHVKRMSEDGEGWNFVNLSRGVKMFACEDGKGCFQNKFNGQDVFPKVNGLLNAKGEVRKLHTLTQRSNYWTRSSADGRFVAYGATPKSAVVDLLPMLQGKDGRKMEVEADYDPAFTPDNQAFIFQGGKHGSRFCNQSLLASADVVTINFFKQGCSESDLEIGLYQAIASSLDSGDITTVNGGFKSDEGRFLFQDTAPFFPENSTMTLSRVRRSETSNFEKVAEAQIATPFAANWMLSPSQELLMGTVSAATPAKRARHGGYHLAMTNADAIVKKNVLPAYNDENSALLCVGAGEKPTISFDERFLVYYAYEQHAETVEPLQSTADLFVIDLLGDGQPLKITAMPKGQYAQFPHFRSDGWLYFTVYDAKTKERTVVATDAVLKL